jgi:transcriptional regulator with XRE-family HTH domain
VNGSIRGGRSGSNEFDRFIGRRLHQERLLAGVSRNRLAGALGIGDEAIRAYECGEMRLPPDRLAAATLALSVPMSVLFYPDDEQALGGGEEDEAEGQLRLARRRPPGALNQPAFALVRPIVALWEERRGELSDDVYRAIRAGGLFHRMVLARQTARSSRLITEHLGMNIRIARPCESLAAIGQDFAEHHRDRAHSAWVAKAYAETLWDGHIRVESIRTVIRSSATSTFQTRYDRVLIPWRCGRGGDAMAMALSLQREAQVAM